MEKRFPKGIKDSLKANLFLVSDNGCQPTSISYMKTCSDLGIKQIFTSFPNPKGNAVNIPRSLLQHKMSLKCVSKC
jgi:putative transposase